MNIGKILKATGSSLLREVPLGGVIADIAGLVLNKDVDKDKVTGDELSEMVDTLPDDLKVKFLNKTIDSELSKFTAWSELQMKMEEESPTSQARAKIAMLIAVVIVLMSAGFGLMLGNMYLTDGRIPELEELLIIFGVPSLALLSFFGIRVGPLQEIIINTLLQRMAKKEKGKK